MVVPLQWLGHFFVAGPMEKQKVLKEHPPQPHSDHCQTETQLASLSGAGVEKDKYL